MPSYGFRLRVIFRLMVILTVLELVLYNSNKVLNKRKKIMSNFHKYFLKQWAVRITRVSEKN